MGKTYKRTIVLGMDYSEFTGGVTKCNAEMKKLDAEFAHASAQMEQNGSKTEKLSLQKEYLTQKINIQAQKVENAKKKYNALADELGYTAKATEKADLALLKERTTLEKLKNQLDDTEDSMNNFEKVTKAAAATFAAMSAAGIKTSMDMAAWADEIATLSNNTGVSMETLQNWSNAAELMDVSVETLTGSVSKMVKNMDNARKGTGASAEAFGKLGLKVTDSTGRLKDAEQMFYETIDALGKIEDKTERDAIAMGIFGKSAQDLEGIISLGSKGIGEMAKKFEDLGITLSSEEMEKLTDLDDSFQNMKLTMGAVGKEIAVTLAPAITTVFDAISKCNPAVLAGIATAAAMVTGIITAVAAFKKVEKGIKATKGVLDLLSLSTDTSTAKILLLVAAIGMAAAAIAVLVGRGEQLNNVFSNVNGTFSSVGAVQRTSAQYHAKGTEYFSGGETWVGEHGPELMRLPRGTQIINNQESKRIANSATYNVTINADFSKVRSIQEVIDIVTGIQQSSGTGGDVVV